MPVTHSLHLGLNTVDPGHYQKIPALRAAVPDAQDWALMAGRLLGYQHQEVLTDGQATAAALLQRLSAFAETLNAGDALLLTYSGHGGQITDNISPNAGDEDTDETWCLYDRQIIDDELYNAFSKFRAGVRITVIADCCHSGTSIREDDGSLTAADIAQLRQQQDMEAELEAAGFQPRKLSRSQCARTFANFHTEYLDVKKSLPVTLPEVAAAVQLFAACQDDQVTYDGKNNGIFTEAFKALLHGDEWRSLTDSNALLERLRAVLKYPKPNYMAYGGDLSVFKSRFPLLAF